MDPLNRF